MNKGLLYLLARIGLITDEVVDHAQERQQLLRAVCPAHEGADNPTAFVLRTDYWLCNTHGCHSTYGRNLEGLVVALADRYGSEELRACYQNGLPPFREAKAFLKRNVGRLRETFKDWPTAKGASRGRSSPSGNRFSYSRETVLKSLLIPAWYFMFERRFNPDILRAYDIGHPHPRRHGVFVGLRDYAVVPLYDLGGSGRCVGYAARAIHYWMHPRWRFSAGFPNEQRLFNYLPACKANRASGQVILVEGVADALRCIEAGFPQTVALLGSALYPEQVKWLNQMCLRDVVVLADNDEAGAKLSKQVQERLSGSAGAVRTIRQPEQVKDIGALSTPEARAFLQTVMAKVAC
jgi:5S rRNA maturation endonuclease (ribonuclease M5)